jgi:hypothetical protein
MFSQHSTIFDNNEEILNVDLKRGFLKSSGSGMRDWGRPAVELRIYSGHCGVTGGIWRDKSQWDQSEDILAQDPDTESLINDTHTHSHACGV